MSQRELENKSIKKFQRNEQGRTKGRKDGISGR
jgi:hypothetical protein